jgi:hypothetical protein
MIDRRKLYTGEESAGRGLLVLRLASVGSFLLTALFVIFFDRAKHDVGLVQANPFAEDPYDAVGSFGVQLGFACSILAVLRAFLTDLRTESLYNRYTYTIRAMAVSQLAIIVTMLADFVALARFSSMWNHSPEGSLLIVFTVGLFVLGSGFCLYLIRLAVRRGVCSQNPLRPRQTVLLLIVLGLLGIYPGSFRDRMAGAILTAAFGMVLLFYSVALLSKAMFPCPDVPEKDLIDDLVGICQNLKPQSGYIARAIAFIENGPPSSRLKRIVALFNPRKHEWNLLALTAILGGFSLALAEIFDESTSRGVDQALLTATVYIVLESAGIFLGYALLRRFLGLVRQA